MKILAVGMNYPQHNKELKETLYKGEEPVIFLKADSALHKNRKKFYVPDFMGRIDYEAEIVVKINRLGKSIPERFAHRYYEELTVGIDFTAREMQERLRAKGLPWTLCKSFDDSAAVGDWIGKEELGDLRQLPFRLDINGQTVQQGNTNEMLFSIDRLISFVSQYFTLKTGDLLFTGTPAGTGAVHIGDEIEGYLGQRQVLTIPCR